MKKSVLFLLILLVPIISALEITEQHVTIDIDQASYNLVFLPFADKVDNGKSAVARDISNSKRSTIIASYSNGWEKKASDFVDNELPRGFAMYALTNNLRIRRGGEQTLDVPLQRGYNLVGIPLVIEKVRFQDAYIRTSDGLDYYLADAIDMRFIAPFIKTLVDGSYTVISLVDESGGIVDDYFELGKGYFMYSTKDGLSLEFGAPTNPTVPT